MLEAESYKQLLKIVQKIIFYFHLRDWPLLNSENDQKNSNSGYLSHNNSNNGHTLACNLELQNGLYHSIQPSDFNLTENTQRHRL